MTYHERKEARTKNYWRWHGVKMSVCMACNGSGYYDSFGSPKCSGCDGLGKCRDKPNAIKEPVKCH
jgi:DnaJ-class molecular chaperone